MARRRSAIESTPRRARTSPARSPRPSTSSTRATPGRPRPRRGRSSAASAAGRRSSRTSRASPHAALIARLGDRLVSRGRPRRDAGDRAGHRQRRAATGVLEMEIGHADRRAGGDRRRRGRRRARPARRLLRRLGAAPRRGGCRSTRSRSATPGAAFGCGVVAFLGERHVRRPGDGPDHGLHGRVERRPVRAVRVRPAGDRRRDRAPRRTAVPETTTCAARALVGAARRARRVPPSRRRRRPAAQRAAGLRRGVRSSTSASRRMRHAGGATLGASPDGRRATGDPGASGDRTSSLADRPDRLRRLRDVRRAAAGADRAR